MTYKGLCAAAAATVMLLSWCKAAAADPMKCSGEYQACVSSCARLGDPALRRTCITTCSLRQAACRQTGCWDNGATTYCGLLRQ